MELLGTHRVTFEWLRSLAIQCHALDISAYYLFIDSTHSDDCDKAKTTYKELFTNQLLNLAIALRTKFYQGGIDPKSTIPYVTHCGFLWKYKQENVEETIRFSMKDVCDKIIHADSLSREMERGVDKPTTSLRGTQNGNEWELSMSVSLFAEAVLNWARDVERM